MTDVNLTPQTLTDVGVEASRTGSLSLSNNYFFTNNGTTILNFIKGSATDCIVTIVTPKTVQGLAVGDRAVTVTGSTGDIFVGPFAPGVYNNANGKVEFTLATNIDGLDVAVLQY